MTAPEQVNVDSHVINTASVFRLALAQREFEITQLTNRNNFFMIFQGVLLAGLVQSQGAAPAVLNFFVCVAGMAMSIFQAGMAGGAKYWQIRWEVAVKHFEIRLLEQSKNATTLMQLFTADEEHLFEDEKLKIRKINAERTKSKLHLIGQEKVLIKDLVYRDLIKKNADPVGNKNGPIPEQKDIANTEEKIDDKSTTAIKRFRVYSPSNWIVLKRFSVSKIPIRVGVVLFFVWAALWINTFSILGKSPWAWTIGALAGESIEFTPFASKK